MWFRLYADEFFECRLDRSAGLVQLVRSAQPFRDAPSLDLCFRNLENRLGLIPRERMGLLIDARGGPARMPPDLNVRFEQHRGEITAGFRAVAVLVRTAIGSAQVRRLSRDDEVEHVVFHEESGALEYLQGALAE